MGMLLSESDKLIILTVAGILIIITFIITTCLVSPWCYLYRIFVKPKENKKDSSMKIVYPSFANPESQHFRLSIVPVYGSDLNANSYKRDLSPTIWKNSFNQFENLTQLAEKARIRYSSLKTDNSKVLPIFPKVDCSIEYSVVSETSIRLHISIRRVVDLKPRDYCVERSVYVAVNLIGFKTQRKSIINKVPIQNQLFRTETVKKSLSPSFVNGNFVSEPLPRCLLKEGSIKLRVIDEERFANDVCVGEIVVALKKIEAIKDQSNGDVDGIETKQPQADAVVADSEQSAEIEQTEPCSSLLTLFPIKEVKGEIFVGFCHLPTSKRVNITVIKASLRNMVLNPTNGCSVHQAFYARLLMFANGKLIKKKKTSLSIRLVWGEEETVSFDLPEEPATNQCISFMVVLSCKFQNSTSPSLPTSPESPESHPVDETPSQAPESAPNSRSNSTNNPQKDLNVGHFVLDKETWQSTILKHPRKQILKWYKLY